MLPPKLDEWGAPEVGHACMLFQSLFRLPPRSALPEMSPVFQFDEKQGESFCAPGACGSGNMPFVYYLLLIVEIRDQATKKI